MSSNYGRKSIKSMGMIIDVEAELKLLEECNTRVNEPLMVKTNLIITLSEMIEEGSCVARKRLDKKGRNGKRRN